MQFLSAKQVKQLICGQQGTTVHLYLQRSVDISMLRICSTQYVRAMLLLASAENLWWMFLYLLMNISHVDCVQEMS
jgi:hypothetical protein